MFLPFFFLFPVFSDFVKDVCWNYFCLPVVWLINSSCPCCFLYNFLQLILFSISSLNVCDSVLLLQSDSDLL